MTQLLNDQKLMGLSRAHQDPLSVVCGKALNWPGMASGHRGTKLPFSSSAQILWLLSQKNRRAHEEKVQEPQTLAYPLSAHGGADAGGSISYIYLKGMGDGTQENHSYAHMQARSFMHTIMHGTSCIPLVSAFARENGGQEFCFLCLATPSQSICAPLVFPSSLQHGGGRKQGKMEAISVHQVHQLHSPFSISLWNEAVKGSRALTYLWNSEFGVSLTRPFCFKRELL